MNENAKKALAEHRQRMKESGEQVERKTFREKLKDNPTSRTIAIYAMCYECCGGGYDGGIRETIRECKVDCPLHAFRPYK